MVEKIDKQKFIEKFKEIYRRKTNKDISDVEALERFEKLILLVEMIKLKHRVKYEKNI